MKSFKEAVAKANKLSESKDKEFFVVLSKNEYDIPGNNYHVASHFDCDTFFQGCDILYSSYEV